MAHMIYRRFGRTEIQMPVLSCGGMRFQHQWKDSPLDSVPRESQENVEAIIHRAVELGICHIETARGYGTSERQLGQVLPKFPRDSLIIQTKAGPMRNARGFANNIQDSLKRLNLSYIDLFAIHGLNDRHTLWMALRRGGCLERARQLQRRRLIRHVGFSTHGPAKYILAAINHPNHGGFDFVNLHWYFVNRRVEPALAAAAARDMGVFIISPSDKGGRLQAPPEKFSALTAPLPPMIFNDLYCLARPEIHTVSVGAARPGDFDTHLQALPHLAAAEETLAPIVKRLEDAMDAVLAPRWREAIQEGLPDWTQTPGKINISIILWLYGLWKAYGMTDYVKERYNLLGNGGHWFPGMNAARAGELNLTRAIAASPLRDRILAILAEMHTIFHEAPKKPMSSE
ncbi:MAG: aldo/keto reductase [Planctomycetota bacterium]